MISNSWTPLRRELLHQQLVGRCNACEKCSLCETRKNVVIHRGNLHQPKVMIIGEAPGKGEDEIGIPFCGKSGSLLDRVLAKAGFWPSGYYICNTVKCWPPDDRGLTDEERAACRGYLTAQIKIVDPDAIVTLGRYAFSALIPDYPIKISRENGKHFDYELGNLVMPLFAIWHPSYVLRNVPLLEEYEADFRRVWQFCTEGEQRNERDEASNS